MAVIISCSMPSFVQCGWNHSNNNNNVNYYVPSFIICHECECISNNIAPQFRCNQCIERIFNANEPNIKYLYHFTWPFGFLGKKRKSFYSLKCIWQKFVDILLFHLEFVEFYHFPIHEHSQNARILLSLETGNDCVHKFEFAIWNSSFMVIIIISAIDIKCDAPTIKTNKQMDLSKFDLVSVNVLRCFWLNANFFRFIRAQEYNAHLYSVLCTPLMY